MRFKKRVPEPRQMGEIESKAFEQISVENYKRWILPLVDHVFQITGKKPMKILDIGCGPGLLVKEFAHSGKHEVVGIDISIHALKLARKNCKGMKNVRFVLAGVQALPFKDNQFDLVISKDSFHHFPNAVQALREMFRVLAPGGFLYIQDLRRDLPEYLLKRAIPPDNVIKKLQYYSARASYTKKEIKALLSGLKNSGIRVGTRKIARKDETKYRQKGIDPQKLKEGFQSRFYAYMKK